MKKFLPLLVLILGAAFVASGLRAPAPRADGFDLAAFGRLPVLVNGRVKPLDTVARTSLLMMQGRQRVSDPTVSKPFVASPAEWLAEVLFNPAKADTYPTFRIDSPEVLALMGIAEADIKITYASPVLRTLALAGFVPNSRSRFSYEKLAPKLPDLEAQARLAEPIDGKLRSPYQKAVVQLRERLILYQRLKHTLQIPDSPDFLEELIRFEKALPAGVAAVRARQKGEPADETAVKAMMEMARRYEVMDNFGYLLAIPPAASEKSDTAWKKAGGALIETFGTGQVNPHVMAYAGLGHAWRAKQSTQFNEITRLYRAELSPRFDTAIHKSDTESKFNAAEPFYRSLELFALAGLIGIISWLRWPQTLGRIGYYLLLTAFIATTIGIATRMWLEGRPPVTNLYSSALFIGWGSVGLCLIIEKISRNSIGTVAGSIIGFITLMIAHHLSLDGDTLEMMRAVLDTNLWLATHVVIITIGYSATFLAGFLALLYMILGIFTPWLSKKPTKEEVLVIAAVATSPAMAMAAPAIANKSDTNAQMLERMVYGIVCFATLCSLVGTILGGIWADQSWGRFWGWDPKENGALLIVIWNAIILHARWGGLVKARGLMALAIFGNVVTSWSWFGTNMLGVGLHSYGFMDSAFYWLLAFVVSQVAIIALAAIPQEKWRSFRPKAA